MIRLLIWPAVLLFPLSIYGVLQHLPRLESPWSALAYALFLDLALVAMVALQFRKRLFAWSDGPLTIVLLAFYVAAPLLWAVLALDSITALQRRQHRFELLEIRKDPASDHRYLFLWTKDGIRRISLPEADYESAAAPSDSATLVYETGLFGLEKITDVRIP